MGEILEVFTLSNEGVIMPLLFYGIGILISMGNFDSSRRKESLKFFFYTILFATILSFSLAVFMTTEATDNEKAFSECIVSSVAAESKNVIERKQNMDKSFGGFKKYEYSIIKEEFMRKHNCTERP